MAKPLYCIQINTLHEVLKIKLIMKKEKKKTAYIFINIYSYAYMCVHIYRYKYMYIYFCRIHYIVWQYPFSYNSSKIASLKVRFL